MPDVAFVDLRINERALDYAVLVRLGNDRRCATRCKVLGGRPAFERKGLRFFALKIGR
jgi:hypothetical protein